MNGFISLHRKIIEWEWYTDADTFRVFIHLLMMANHAPGKVRGIQLKRGQHITSTVRLLETLDITFSRVRKALKTLKKGGEIIIENPSNKYSLVTIVKYDDYQKSELEFIKQTSSKHQADIKQTSTNNKNNNNNKNNKNNNNYNNNIYIYRNSYFKNDKLVKGVAKSQNITDDQVKSEMEEFMVHLENNGNYHDDFSKFKHHFLSFLKKRQEKLSLSQVKLPKMKSNRMI